MIQYIATPPPERPDKPWLLCMDGAVRYATSHDTTFGLEQVPLNAEQYDWLLASAGLS